MKYIKTNFFNSKKANESQECQSSKTNKVNSLAFLAYKNRIKKGLIENQPEECPIIYFGDEWAF